MLFTKYLEDEQVFLESIEDFDIAEDEREFAFETSLHILDCNYILCEAEQVAIEAYSDYNGNMSVLESQFEVVKEEAEKGFIDKIKGWISKAWNWIKTTVIKIKNWIIGLFSKRQAFINKYKDDETEVTVDITNFDKAKKKILEYSKEATTMADKVKEFYNDLTSGKLFPAVKDGMSPFDYIMANKSIFGISHDYKSLNEMDKQIREDCINPLDTQTFKLKDFVKDMQDFFKLKDDVYMKTFDKKVAKISLSILAAFSKDEETGNKLIVDKSKTLLSAARDATTMIIKIITAYAGVIKEIISESIKEIEKKLSSSNK